MRLPIDFVSCALLARVSLAALMVWTGSLAGLSVAAESLKAGVARVEITPSMPVTMAGYANRTDVSTGVHDPLYARAVAFRCGDSRLVLVSTDLIGFRDALEPFRLAICRRVKLEPDQLLLTATHTHAGPNPTLNGSSYNGPAHPNNIAYTKELLPKLVDLVAKATAAEQEVAMGVGQEFSPIGVNRREVTSRGVVKLGRNPDGPTDKEVLVIKLVAADDKPVAALFGYACHGTTMGGKNLTISSDCLGQAAQFVEKLLGPSTLAPVFAGASGNIDPYFRVLPAFETTEHWTPEVDLLGTMLGTEVMHVYRATQTTRGPVAIASALATVDLPVKEDAEDQSPLPFVISVARLGDTGIVGLGGEVLTEIGLAIKAGSPFQHTLVITHCNGGAGYLAPKHLYPQGGYEIETSHFGPEAADMVVKRSLAMLHRLAASPATEDRK